jgi:hypothetical protein
MPIRSVRKTLRFHVLGSREAFGDQEARGEWEKGDDFPIGRVKGKPGELERSGEHVVPARTKPSGAMRGTAFRVGIIRWSAGVKLLWFHNKAHERQKEPETVSRPPGGKKALKSEA